LIDDLAFHNTTCRRDRDLVLVPLGGGPLAAGLVPEDRYSHGGYRDGDDEHDEKHEHDVDERSRIDLHHRLTVVLAA
jgi:hypothetical protein